MSVDLKRLPEYSDLNEYSELNARAPSEAHADKSEAHADKSAVIANLRDRIRTIERHTREPLVAPVAASTNTSTVVALHQRSDVLNRGRWRLGEDAVDRLLPEGLTRDGVHEIKGVPSIVAGASVNDWMSGFGFALRLARRRLALRDEAGPDRQADRDAVQDSGQHWWMLAWPRALALEFGRPSAAGLARLGLNPERLILVETARADDALNALEESLRARAVTVAVGAFHDLDLTPARRLSLAASDGATSCLLVTHPASAPALATATRWRVGRALSAPNTWDARAPGAQRFSVRLDRCRARPASTTVSSSELEWCDETHRFRLAASLASDASRPRRAEGRAA